MRIVLRQDFPLGRFHATPWRASVFDDPDGEWPPSPWRLIRAIAARGYQWRRECGPPLDTSTNRLVEAFCAARVSFHLPASARRGLALRQYHPVECGWQPPNKTTKENGRSVLVPGMKAYGITLVQDNYWSVAPDEPVWWFLDGDGWDQALLEVLDRCLERLVYFGRAETLTECRRWTTSVPAGCAPNCLLEDVAASAGHVRVLTPRRDATRADIERMTDHPEARERTVPPGARWMYARLPERPRVYERRKLRSASHPPVHLMQFALASAVVPEPRATCRITARFRDRVLGRLARRLTGNRRRPWRQAPAGVVERLALMSGLGPDRTPLRNHEHAHFVVWFNGGTPERLLVWRSAIPFGDREQEAILDAARGDVSWSAVPRGDEWRVRMIPLDRSAASPPGFDGAKYSDWESLTPYVPPRHRFRRGGKERAAEAPISQLRRSLKEGGWPSTPDQLTVEIFGPPRWAAVHLPPATTRERRFLGDRMGFTMRLRFQRPVVGPIMVGHSSHFGLGLFGPSELQTPHKTATDSSAKATA